MAKASSRLGALLLALTLCACAGPIREQGMAASFSDGRFQVEWQTAQTPKGSPLIAGYVTNTRGGGVSNVRMRIETLDAQGQVIATATALVPAYIGGFSRTQFEVPLERAGLGYRVSIIGWDASGSGS